ncbi:hypothetical protein A6J39_020275 [Legionella anisa]|uniref:Transmembrane protein n=2 Tax=Legionella anisa TaxID=28082 RepID=A0AAX0WYB7_9GAMM|nr:hypothetical protein DLD14_02990 [Legionella anisa]PNL63342.1 hypothetical protein A6J39_020275 [Legionella anisa]
MFVVAACCSMVSIYGLYVGDQLTTYDYISGVFTTVSNLLWLGASSYDIYLTCNQKYEAGHNKEGSDIENDDQLDDIEKQLKLQDASSLSKYQPIIQKIKIKTPSLNKRHSSDNLLTDDPGIVDLHIKFKHQDKVQIVQIPGVFFKKEKVEAENFNDVYENSLKKKIN